MPGVALGTSPCWIAAAVLGSVLLAAPPSGVGREPPSAAPRPLSGAIVEVTPGSRWLESGENVTLRAAWVDVPPGCSVQPIWFRWSIASGGSEGILGASNGSSVVFSSTSAATGTTVVSVRAAAVARCDGSQTAAIGRATAQVTVAAPLTLIGLQAAPDPRLPGERLELNGSVVGGSPPYRIDVAWGDGSSTTSAVAANFSLAHRYQSAATYRPSVTVVDAVNAAVTGATLEPVFVSSVFAAAIEPTVAPAEVGLPVGFRVALVAAPRNFSSVFGCDGGSAGGNQSPALLRYSCVFSAAGTTRVTFEAVGASPPYPLAYTWLEEPVVPAPSLLLGVGRLTGETGETLYAPFDLAGGCPPYQLTWALVGAGTNGTLTLAADGRAYLPLASPRAGTFEVSLRVQDGRGAIGVAADSEVVFDAGLASQVAIATRDANGSLTVNLSASIAGGAPPFDWAVLASSTAPNASAGVGALDGDGAFAWNASWRGESPTWLVVLVVDRLGEAAGENLSIAAGDALRVSAEAHADGPGRVTLVANVSGGAAPYSLLWSDGLGEAWNASARAAGLHLLNVSTGTRGFGAFTVRVTDADGRESTASANASWSGDPTTGSPGPTVADGAALVLAAVAAVLGLWELARRRRRSGGAPPPVPPDPVAVLREVIQPSDGVDRALVEMLAEERGVEAGIVRATLERLKQQGLVLSEVGFDGEEALSWDPASDRGAGS